MLALIVSEISTFKNDLEDFGHHVMGMSMSIKVVTGIVALALIVLWILRIRMIDLENLGQVTKYMVRSGPIRWQISMSIEVMIGFLYSLSPLPNY